MSDNEIYDITDTVFAIYKTVPVQITSSIGEDICKNETTLLDAGEGFTNYTWSTGDLLQSVEASIEGDYIVEVTDINGCMSVDTFSLKVHPLPEKPVITASDTNVFCRLCFIC